MGLRRAFLTAGAQNLVMSLWEVPDDETRWLMGDFYGRVLKGADPVEALTEAQRAALANQRARGPQHVNPWQWGAFVVCASAVK